MSDRDWTQADEVMEIVTLGSKWGNENRGGFYFNLKSHMPGDVDYFIVRPMDLGLEVFLTQLLSAISNTRQVEIHYEKEVPTENAGKFEGDVVAIKLL